MFYPPEILEEVQGLNDIVSVVGSYLKLTQKGSSHFGLCPFHNESTPSFSISADKQLYYCFGCGAAGNVINFVMKIENLDFVSTIKFLADRVNYSLPEREYSESYKKRQKEKDTLYEIHVISARFFYENLQSEDGEIAKKYLDERNMSTKVRRIFGIGYAGRDWDSLYKHLMEKGFDIDAILKSGLVLESRKSKGKYFDRFRGRIMFPIINNSNKIIGFGGRTIHKEDAKYLNSPETMIFDKSRNLYALNIARRSQAKDAILVEGYIDTISLHQVGISNTVASLGTALTKEHARLLNSFFESVTILFDTDKAGVNATIRSIPILTSAGLKVNIADLSGAKDPDEFIVKFGKDKFLRQLQNSKGHISYQIDLLSKKYDLTKSNEKSEFINETSKLLSSLSDIDKSIYLQEINKLTGIDEKLILGNVDLYKDEFAVNIEKNIKDKKAKNKSNLIVAKDKGLYDAQDYLIYIISQDKNVYNSVREDLLPEEFSDEVYQKILKTLYILHDKGNNTNVADIINYFDEEKDIQIIYKIFDKPVKLDNYGKIQKAINDNIKIVKTYNLESMLVDADNDADTLNQIFSQLKELKNWNITLIDGLK